MFLQNLSNTNVWETMEALRSRLDRLFYNTAAYSAGDFPPLNLWSSEEKVVVQALVPGAVAEDLDIHVSGQVMRISLSAPQCSEQGAMQQQERGACALTRECNCLTRWMQSALRRHSAMAY
jgi:HSP20 family molecular chaperone IbpA